MSKFVRQLKKSVLSKDCLAIEKAISKSASGEDDNDEIKKELLEFERFYRVFHIANQFFDLPLPMLDPIEYGIEGAYYLAMRIAQWKDQDHEISKRLFKSNKTLTKLFHYIQETVKQSPTSAADSAEKAGEDAAEPWW